MQDQLLTMPERKHVFLLGVLGICVFLPEKEKPVSVCCKTKTVSVPLLEESNADSVVHCTRMSLEKLRSDNDYLRNLITLAGPWSRLSLRRVHFTPVCACWYSVAAAQGILIARCYPDLDTQTDRLTAADGRGRTNKQTNEVGQSTSKGGQD